MRSRWLAYHRNTLIRIILIQKPEPSGGEAAESRVWNRVREIWPTKQLTHALQGSFTCRKSTTWTDGFTSLRRKCALRILSLIKIHRPRPGRNPQQRVPWVPWQAREVYKQKENTGKKSESISGWKKEYLTVRRFPDNAGSSW
jgi:hypothetical protein